MTRTAPNSETARAQAMTAPEIIPPRASGRLTLKKVLDLVLVEDKTPAEAAARGQKWIEKIVREIGR